MQSFIFLVDGISGIDNDPRYKAQLGRAIKPIFCYANIPREISTSLGLEVEGDDATCAERSVNLKAKSLGKTEGTWPVPSGRVRQIYPKSQAKVDLGSGQVYDVDRRPGLACGSDPELGQAHGRYLGLGLDNQVTPSPSPTSWSPLARLDSIDPSRLKAVGMGIGSS